MMIFDPVGDGLEALLFPDEGRRFVCTVNGERTFRGEVLPVGTLEEIGTWICDRYRLQGELTVNKYQEMRVVWYRAQIGWWGQRTWGWRKDPIRLLVMVGDAEYLFLLTPIKDLRLTWNGLT